MKKRQKLLRALIFFTVLDCLLLTSCKYGLQNFFYRAPQPNERSGVLAVLDPPLDAPPAGMGGSGGFSNTNPGKIKFLVITDLHYGSKSTYPDEMLLATFELEKPDLIFMLGDSAEAGLPQSFIEYEQFLAKIREKTASPGYLVPNFAILGNHDLYNNGLASWKKIRSGEGEGGKTFYKFETKVTDIDGNEYVRSWYFLDSASSTLGNKQLEALQNAFKNDLNPKFVFSHFPLYTKMNFHEYYKWSNVYERAILIDLYDKSNVNMIFSGHWHPGSAFDYGNFIEIGCGSFRPDTTEKKYNHWHYITVDETAKTITVEGYLFSPETGVESAQKSVYQYQP